MHHPTYKAAVTVSATVVAHFAQHLAIAAKHGEQNLATAPDAKIVEKMIDIAFWASLRREEGHSPRISLAYLAPEQAGDPLLLQKRLKLTPDTLTKLAPGAERAGIHLGVWYEDNELYIWGTTINIPNLCFVLDVSEPALLVIKHRSSYGFGKFTNVAVLKGDQVKVVDERSSERLESPAILRTLLGTEPPSARNDAVNINIQLAVSMRAHGHGGILLVVPSGSDKWMDSIIQPMTYSVAPAFSGLANLVKFNGDNISLSLWQSALRRGVDNLAGLTAIDGATIISDQHELLAFGAKIGRREGGTRVERISVIEPVVGGEAVIVHPGQSGGTRHLSAAQFIHDQPDALAMVASQDGHFTVFTWSPVENMVTAYRIESLLL